MQENLKTQYSPPSSTVVLLKICSDVACWFSRHSAVRADQSWWCKVAKTKTTFAPSHQDLQMTKKNLPWEFIAKWSWEVIDMIARLQAQKLHKDQLEFWFVDEPVGEKLAFINNLAVFKDRSETLFSFLTQKCGSSHWDSFSSFPPRDSIRQASSSHNQSSLVLVSDCQIRS